MIEVTKYYPDWLFEALIEDFLPWEIGKQYSFEEFASKYTFHDSSWIGLYLNLKYENSATIALIWDPYFLPDDTHEKAPMVQDWPFLFVRITSLMQVVTDGLTSFDFPREVQSAESKVLGAAKQSLIFNCDGGQIKIDYSGDMTFLSLDRDKVPLSI